MDVIYVARFFIFNNNHNGFTFPELLVDYVPINVNKRTGKSTVSIKTGLDTIILILRLSSLFNPLKFFSY